MHFVNLLTLMNIKSLVNVRTQQANKFDPFCIPIVTTSSVNYLILSGKFDLQVN